MEEQKEELREKLTEELMEEEREELRRNWGRNWERSNVLRPGWMFWSAAPCKSRPARPAPPIQWPSAPAEPAHARLERASLRPTGTHNCSLNTHTVTVTVTLSLSLSHTHTQSAVMEVLAQIDTGFYIYMVGVIKHHIKLFPVIL